MNLIRHITIFLLLMMPCSASAITITEAAGKFSCPGIANQQQCAITFEEKILASDRGLLIRDKEQLKIRLSSGKYKSLPDKHAVLNPIEVTNGFAVIREQFGEGNTWHVLSLYNGELMETKGYPLFSPDGKYALCSQQDVEANYSPNILALYEVTEGSLKKVFDAHPDSEGWGPGDVKWLNSKTASFTRVSWEAEQENVSADEGPFASKPYFLVLTNGSWIITDNKDD